MIVAREIDHVIVGGGSSGCGSSTPRRCPISFPRTSMPACWWWPKSPQRSFAKTHSPKGFRGRFVTRRTACGGTSESGSRVEFSTDSAAACDVMAPSIFSNAQFSFVYCAIEPAIDQLTIFDRAPLLLCR